MTAAWRRESLPAAWPAPWWRASWWPGHGGPADGGPAHWGSARWGSAHWGSAHWGPFAQGLTARHRTWLTATLAAAAMACAITAVTPRAAAGVPVLAAARDLAAGTVLTSGDLVAVRLGSSLVPAGAFSSAPEALGRSLAGPLRRGEPLTDARLVGPALLAGVRGGVDAVALRVADGSTALVSAGDRVDVVGIGVRGGDGSGAAARVVAPDLLVLSVPGPPDPTSGAAGADPPLVILAATPATAVQLAEAAATGHVSLLLRPPG